MNLFQMIFPNSIGWNEFQRWNKMKYIIVQIKSNFQQRLQSIFQFHETEPRFARFSISGILPAATFVSFLTQPK